MEETEKSLEFAARFAAEKGLIRFTRFLDPAQLAAAKQIAVKRGAGFACYGGYERAERAIGCFYPHTEAVRREDFPLVCLHASFSAKFCSLSHRDILGAFMALGLTRDCIGDIIIVDADVYLFTAEKTADYVAQSLTSAAKTPLHFHVQAGTAPIPEPRGSAFRAVVTSLRLDAVVASAYRLSRAQAALAIRGGAVKLDHIPCDRVDAPVTEGAMLSMKGMGRVRVQGIEGLTKKQRIGLTCFRYE